MEFGSSSIFYFLNIFFFIYKIMIFIRKIKIIVILFIFVYKFGYLPYTHNRYICVLYT